jgi:hypothetical protein
VCDDGFRCGRYLHIHLQMCVMLDEVDVDALS